MARFQRGWLRIVKRKEGRMWQLRYNAIDPATGKKKESAIIVGVLVDFPTESACWREVDRQRLTDKIKQVMMVVLRHAEKYGRLPTGLATELGKQISISTSSDYEAVILTPEQTMTILSYMRQPERTLTLLIAATGLRWSEIAGLQWQDIDWARNRIHLRRTFIDGTTTERLKTKKSKSAVAMAPLLARYLKEWQRETLY